MKKLAAVMLIACALFTISASAQVNKKAMKSGAGKQVLMDSLQISAETADSVIAIRKESMSQMKAITSDESLSKEDKKAKAKPVKEEMQAHLKKFLNDDQIAKLQEMEMAMRQNRKKDN